MRLTELQLDRLVGPTHHFGGLGVGNIASRTSAGRTSNPKSAALQGLDKMQLVASLGAPQLILPPQPRPQVETLRRLGFGGSSDGDVLKRALDADPDLLAAVSSCSAMWTANAATVTPGVDAGHHRTTATVANLVASIHRALEPPRTAAELRRCCDGQLAIADPIPGGAAMRDEGAANHMRLSDRNSPAPGINVFVFGDQDPLPVVHWPRQSRAACQAVARLHRLAPADTFLFKQHPDAIDSGAFHNDVVAISHHNLLIHHELAFWHEHADLSRLESRFQQLTGTRLHRIEVLQSELTLADAIKTYLFNSQVVSTAGSDQPTIICAAQVADHPAAKRIVTNWCESNLFAAVHFVNLDQSMSGGGGPACLRLRIPVPQETVNHFSGPRWTPSIDQQLRELINRDYPDSLGLADLARDDFRQHALDLTRRIKRLVDCQSG